MLPYVRIEDLGVGDFVKVDCTACHRVALLTAEGVLRAGRRSELDRSQFDPIFGPIWRERSDCPDRFKWQSSTNATSWRAVMANTREHRYSVSVTWNGNLGSGTSGYRDYSRNYEIGADGKAVIHGSADPAFRGDRSRWNPEVLLVASLSACHKLWYLHLAAEAGIVVTAYVDRAEGVMEVGRDGVGRFKSGMLHPAVTVTAGSDVEHARTLHKPAHEKCFIANSVNFPVECEPEILVAG